jgi:hypothetical protein
MIMMRWRGGLLFTIQDKEGREINVKTLKNFAIKTKGWSKFFLADF